MKFHLLRHFLALEHHRSFTAAAADLDLSQSALTKSIQALEKSLGVQLFYRLPRRVEPTAYGKVLAEHAHLICAEVDLASAEIDALKTGAFGTVRIGAGPGWIVNQLPAAIKRLHHTNANVKVSVADGLNDDLFELLERGRVEFVVCSLSEESLEAQFEYEKLVADQYLVMARRDHPLAARDAVDLEELAAYPWVLPGGATFTRQRFNEVFLRRGLRPPEPAVEANSFVLRSSVVRLGRYLGFHAEQNLRVLSDLGLGAVNVPSAKWKRSAGIVTRRHSLLSAAARILMKELARTCREGTEEMAPA